MGTMIYDDDVIASLARIAEREGITKAAALRLAMENLLRAEGLSHDEACFSRDRVTRRGNVVIR
jgi:hypothetical protein